MPAMLGYGALYVLHGGLLHGGAPMSKHTPGPWEVWSGPQYVGGGADLCIGAGKDWLANMDHRNCVNREAHMCGGDIPPCKREPDTAICSTAGCRCTDECPEENHITEEQRANANLIAAAPDLLEALKVAHGFVAAFSGYYQVAYETGAQIHPKHQEALDQIAAALARAEGR
jgi:hypothetical protein